MLSTTRFLGTRYESDDQHIGTKRCLQRQNVHTVCTYCCFFAQTEGVRVWVNLLTESPKSPILFVVRQKQAVLSFQVPLILRGL